jgi:hypothetical protein
MTQDNLATRDDDNDNNNHDTGAHYRFMYNGVKLDPFRIANIYGVNDFALQTILKKCLCAGERGHKDKRRDLEDIITAAKRAIEMIDEDDKNGL